MSGDLRHLGTYTVDRNTYRDEIDDAPACGPCSGTGRQARGTENEHPCYRCGGRGVTEPRRVSVKTGRELVTVVLEGDLGAIGRRLASMAARNKNGRASLNAGAFKARVTKREPVAE